VDGNDSDDDDLASCSSYKPSEEEYSTDESDFMTDDCCTEDELETVNANNFRTKLKHDEGDNAIKPNYTV